eukprot:TRINITY_DN3973_c0_g1_i5.p1 TRINITY_DN3973_c0_g1~~TRINITY_DN3973_c0_g1_i5.p1  ORF type:complete len:404 (-),score=60.87 TRINITY_DN3973_c0_g1_i5:129-1340(-)
MKARAKSPVASSWHSAETWDGQAWSDWLSSSSRWTWNRDWDQQTDYFWDWDQQTDYSHEHKDAATPSTQDQGRSEWSGASVQSEIASELQQRSDSETNSAERIEARIAIPKRLVKAFIGKGGEGCKQVQARSGCAVFVREEDERHSAVMVCGPSAAVGAIADSVKDRIAQLEDNFKGKTTMFAPISQHIIRAFIGAEATEIKKLEASTGCSVHVDREAGNVKVCGPRDAAINALETVRHRIAQLEEVHKTQGRNVQMEIHDMLREFGPEDLPLARPDFDYKVLLHLRELDEKLGRKAVRRALAYVFEATSGRSRKSVQRWPAYILTLLRKFDSNATRPPQAKDVNDGAQRAGTTLQTSGGQLPSADDTKELTSFAAASTLNGESELTGNSAVAIPVPESDDDL